MTKSRIVLTLAVALTSFSAFGGTACTYYRDAEGIPHFTVKTKLEAWGCMGYFHGLDRAWQSDYLRRTALGTRAEIEGFSALKDDLKMRLFGFAEIADRIVKGLDPTTLEALRAYSAGWNLGANDAVASGKVYELKTWKQDFPKWTPRDTIILLLLQSFDQTRRTFEQRFTQATLIGRYGAAADRLNDNYGTPWDTTVIKAEDASLAAKKAPVKTLTAKRPPLKGAEIESLRDFFAFHYLDFLGDSSTKGSNNWVVAPERTENGVAVLMNDPHLGLTTPAFWYWLEINIEGEGSTFGATLPGGPLVTSGTNEHVAWGLTNSYFDVSDVAYISPALVPDLVSFKPKVYVNVLGAKVPVSLKTFQKTKDGFPVLPVESPKGKIALLKWTGFTLEAKDFPALLDVPFMKSAPDADRTFARIGLPSWNFVFADVDGKIGHRVIGKLPRMTSAHFGIPVLDKASDVAAYRAWSFLTADEAPHVLSPARGYVASANEQSWPKDHALSAGRAQVPSFRAFRIEELLNAKARHSLDDLRAVQCDVQAIDARFIRPLLLNYSASFASRVKADPYGAKALAALKDWNGVADLESVGSSVYRFWMNGIMAAVGGAETEVYHLLRDPQAYDVDSTTFRAMLAKTWDATVVELKKIDPNAIPVWKNIHRAPFRHLSKNDAWNPRNPVSTPGDANTVNPGSWDSVHPGEHSAGASMRTQIELTRPPRIALQLTGIDEDVPNPDLSKPGSAWRNFAACRITAREFPSNFAAHATSTVRW